MAYHKANDGWLREDDLSDFRVDVETPLSVRFGDVTLFGCRPWCQGPVLLQTLKILDGLALKGLIESIQRIKNSCRGKMIEGVGISLPGRFDATPAEHQEADEQAHVQDVHARRAAAVDQFDVGGYGRDRQEADELVFLVSFAPSVLFVTTSAASAPMKQKSPEQATVLRSPVGVCSRVTWSR